MGVATTVLPNYYSAKTTGLRLENPKKSAIIRHVSECDLIDWYNVSGQIILAGEPIIHNNQVCISATPILPGEMGAVYRQWIADFWISGTLGADILMNALVYWQYDANGVYTGSGGAVAAAPTNGFILGRAGLMLPAGRLPTLNGSDKPIAAANGASGYGLRVVSITDTHTTYGTIGTYA